MAFLLEMVETGVVDPKSRVKRHNEIVLERHRIGREMTGLPEADAIELHPQASLVL